MSRDRRSSSYACAAAVFTLFSVSASWAQTPGPLNAITDVPGIEVGQYTSTDATSGGGTGTTVVVSRAGAVGGVSQRGGAPGTRETDPPAPRKPGREGQRGRAEWSKRVRSGRRRRRHAVPRGPGHRV